MTQLLTRECEVVVLVASRTSRAPSRAGKVLYTTPRPPMSGDRYRVWLVQAPPSRRAVRRVHAERSALVPCTLGRASLA